MSIYKNSGFTKGDRVQIPVHYDNWIRGDRFGEVVGHREGGDDFSACLLVRLDRVEKIQKVWALDWNCVKSVP